MIAKDRGRKLRLVGFGLVVLAVAAARQAPAQQGVGQRYDGPQPIAGAGAAAQNSTSADQPKRLSQINVPPVQKTRIPVEPSDPIAVVNNQVISRQQLADECVAREGKKILELLVNRTLIEQALARRRLSITAPEIDQEIDDVARRFGVNREGWLKTLDKERGISPSQYAREIIYPALALRKLCAGRVQVTDRDLQEAFESQYGDKLRCRMILVDKQELAMRIWDKLHENPGGFEKMAQECSMDPGSRSLGGLLAEPITRHAIPKNLSEKAFQQLVDGDPSDRDPTHKPKNGDFTGPIQAAEAVWVILRREDVIPAAKDLSLKDKRVHDQVYEMIYQVKLKDAMKSCFEELLKAAAIENRLTGQVKLANEEKEPDYRVDGNVKLMGNKGSDPSEPPTASAVGSTSRAKIPPPPGLSPEAAKEFRPLKPGGNPPPSN
jgi:parvulin-like peptidyl-prolyl isomerase